MTETRVLKIHAPLIRAVLTFQPREAAMMEMRVPLGISVPQAPVPVAVKPCAMTETPARLTIAIQRTDAREFLSREPVAMTGMPAVLPTHATLLETVLQAVHPTATMATSAPQTVVIP